MTMAQSTTPQALLNKRLLDDIAELHQKPYPGITLHIQDSTALQSACLILTPENEAPLHLTIDFNPDYPLSPPEVTIQSRVSHPNVYDDYICASILNTREGYTSAYTLKAVCIQLLSFFGSERIEQEYGGFIERRDREREREDERGVEGYKCADCGFGEPVQPSTPALEWDEVMEDADDDQTDLTQQDGNMHIWDLPQELLLLVCDKLDDEELVLAAQAWNGFGRVMRAYNIIRTREMQCFTLKKGFNKTSLGVGVHVQGRTLQSEFDLISYEAFHSLWVRRSVQGLPFEYWLPLPISEMHWRHVESNIENRLDSIARAAGIRGSLVTVLYTFMNDIVVRLSREASDLENGQSFRTHLNHQYLDQQSTLTVVSEKAIESYFHLFHLLLCLATKHPQIVKDADNTIKEFLAGKRDKSAVPNLGHLLIMVLISSHQVTEDLTQAIITEAITRNVVWMLDVRGQNMPELSFMESDAVSEYRLQKTFDAGKTSYRLLMFANLMKRTVKQLSSPSKGNEESKTLVNIRDDLFKRHGGAPNGTAAQLADSVRRIQRVKAFPAFLTAMGMTQMPSREMFTDFLRRTVGESVEKGYSKWALRQEEALALRVSKEPEVGRPERMMGSGMLPRTFTFFPQDRRGRQR